MRNNDLYISHDELINMVLLQGETIQILIEKVENLKTGIGKLGNDLRDKIVVLEKRSDIKDDEIGYIHWNFEPTH